MDQETFNNLKPGDRLLSAVTGKTYTVEGAGTHKGDKAHRVRCEDGTMAAAFHALAWDLVPPPETVPGPVSYPHAVPIRVAARLWHATPEEAEGITRLLDDMNALTRADRLERKGFPIIAECVRRRVLGPPDPDPTRDTLEKLARTLGERLSEAALEMTKLREERDTLGEMNEKLRKERDRIAEDCKRAEEVRNDSADARDKLREERDRLDLYREHTLVLRTRLAEENEKLRKERDAAVGRLAEATEQRNDFADACDKLREERDRLKRDYAERLWSKDTNTECDKEHDEMVEACKRVERLCRQLVAENYELRMGLTRFHDLNVIFAESNDRLETTLAEQALLTGEARAAAEKMRARLADAAEHTFSWEDEQEDNG